MKPTRHFLLLTLLLALPAWPGEKGGNVFTVGVESSFGDLLSYPSSGFQFSLKPYLNLDVAGSGFVLSLAYGFPIAPWGGPTQLELAEEYAITLSEKAGLDLTFGNDNSLTFGNPVTAGGFVYFRFGWKGWGLGSEITYLDGGAFGFGKVSIIPGYNFEIGKNVLGVKVKFNLGLASAPTSLGLEPLLSFDHSF